MYLSPQALSIPVSKPATPTTVSLPPLAMPVLACVLTTDKKSSKSPRDRAETADVPSMEPLPPRLAPRWADEDHDGELPAFSAQPRGGTGTADPHVQGGRCLSSAHISSSNAQGGTLPSRGARLQESRPQVNLRHLGGGKAEGKGKGGYQYHGNAAEARVKGRLPTPGCGGRSGRMSTRDWSHTRSEDGQLPPSATPGTLCDGMCSVKEMRERQDYLELSRLEVRPTTPRPIPLPPHITPLPPHATTPPHPPTRAPPHPYLMRNLPKTHPNVRFLLHAYPAP